MSLINDALRKARQEATEQNDRNGGPDVFALRQPPTTNVPFSTGLILGAIIAGVAALGGAAIVWWGMSQDTEPATLVAATAPEPERGIPDINVTSGETVPPRRSDAVPPQQLQNLFTAEPEAGQPELPAAEPVALSAEVTEDTGHLPDPVPAELPKNETAKPATTSQREFVEFADLPTGSLRLDYIVFRATDPFAEINSIEVRVGSFVEGFQVEKIAVDRILLRNEDGPLTLRVH